MTAPRAACGALVIVFGGALALAAAPGCRGERGSSGGGAGTGASTASGARSQSSGSGSGDDQPAWPVIDEAALAALQTTERFELGTPAPLAITPDGAVLFRRSKPRNRVADLYQLDASGKITQLANAAALVAAPPPAPPGAPGRGAAAEPPAPPELGAGIDVISVSDDGARVLIPLAGRLFLLERSTGVVRELAIGPYRDAQLSPDGKRVAFVRGGDLWVLAVGEPQPVRIAQHPAADKLAADDARDYATPDPAARAFGRDRGYWWSPDSQAIAFERCDARAVEPRYVADPRHPEQPPAMTRIPRPGTPIAAVDLGLVSVRGGAPRWVSWDREHYPYLAQAIWPARGPLTLVVVGRTQTIAAVVTVDPATTASRQVLVDKDPAWVNVLPDGLAWLPDGSGFLWMTEASGAWSVEHHAADGGHVRTVLTADVGARRIAGISPDGHDAVIEGASDAREQQVWRVPLAGGAPVALTSGGGVHTARAAHGIVAISSLLRAGGRATTVIRADGSRTPLPSVADHPAAPPTTQFETLLLHDHAQLAALTRPHAFDPKLRYPVVLRIGGAPDTRSVVDALDTYLLDQWYADQGFIVVRSDGRGTPGPERSWQRAIAGDVLTVPMTDQIDALKRLAAHHPELDLGRVGALGGEIGGYLAAMAVLLHPDVFAAAVAVSPITDWSLVDAATAERYLKAPAFNAEGYRRTTAAVYADHLTRPLLLLPAVPGSRIATAHAFQLIDALSAAGKHAEIATWPDRADAAHRIAATRLVLDFFRQRLGPPVRPRVMPAARTDDDDEDEERERRARRGSESADQDRH
ncbi:MAG TPA: DPP IV N-terminal domain-containing protein [Kofleriaceae bacterium]|jgi:dipeptidyl-peptidase-4|nr:DPP IV N-terminal domain-containing protein [Kofleriaceae bacterium]